MANLKELRLRISSVKNTRKITSAMSQIASARLRKAQNAALAARPYGDRMREVVEQLVGGIDPAERAAAHPLLAQRDPVERVLLLVMTANRGLCGGFNANVIRGAVQFAEREQKEGRQVVVRLIGAKGAAVLKPQKGWTVRGKHEAPVQETIVPLSKTVASHAMEAFLASEPDQRVDRVVLYYNHFVSVLTQKVTELQIVPLRPPETPGEGAPAKEPTFEPSRAEILAHLVPVAIESMLQQAMFNSVAAEVAARRVAMDAATDNATEMIADLTLEYNRERQAAITKELMEIIGGAEALKG
jgi:F-type H+-transporting ATPase subunit gamma